MANNIGWGQGAVNNSIGWGQGASSNSISWGISQKDSYSGETEIYGIRGDVDAVAFNSRVTANGGTLSALEQTAINQLVVDLKAYGLWDSMKAIYPMVGASAAACAQNLKSSSFTGTFTSGWTFASTGATPNGTSAFMNTFVSPSSILSLNSTHISYYSRTNSNNPELEIGAGNSTSINALFIEVRTSGTSYFKSNTDTTFLSFIDTDSRAWYMCNRNASNSFNAWKNSTKYTSATSSTGITSNNIYIGAVNFSDVASFPSTKQCAFASIGDGLTDTQASNFYIAVQNFNTTLNRQV